MLIVQNIPLESGIQLQPFTIFLQQRTQIRGVVVDNANSTVDVLVYASSAPNGIPFVVKAGWARGFAINEGYASVFVVFNRTPTAAGQITITVADEPQSAFSEQVVATEVISPYPQGAVPFTFTIKGPLLATGTAFTSTAVMITPGQSLWLVFMQTWQLNRQAFNQWVLNYISNTGPSYTAVMYGNGDTEPMSFPVPIQCPWLGSSNGTSGLQLSLNSGTIYGTWNVDALIQGYVL